MKAVIYYLNNALLITDYTEITRKIKEAIRIEDIISEVVQLSWRGHVGWGLCCFHQEKTGSLTVDKEKQLFYCHGCHVGGDVYKFVMLRDKCSFREAQAYLAERAGISVNEKVPIEAYRARRKAEQERQKKQDVEQALAKLVKVTRLEVFAAERWVYSIRKTIVDVERLDSPVAQWAIKHGPHIERIADTLIGGDQTEQMQACLAWEGLKNYGKLFR
ncbi:MAG: CHC2 zinc finger domain-containing protein [Syntrophomonadaceae bacterium]